MDLDFGILLPVTVNEEEVARLKRKIESMGAVNLAAYAVHDLTFFLFLCFLPLGKHFHVITSLFNVFFMRVRLGNVKPVRHGVPDSELDKAIIKEIDMTPGGIIRRLNLRRPIYRKTASYGHFGRNDKDFTWEKLDLVDKLLKAIK